MKSWVYCSVVCKHKFFSGDNQCGKTTLVAKLQGIDDLTKGIGLEYAYIDIRDEYKEG